MSGAGSGLFKDIGSMGMERTSSWADVGDDEFDEWDLPEPTVMGGAQTAASPRSRLGPGDAGGGRGPGDGGQGGEAGAGDDDGGGAGAVDRAEIPAIVDPFAAEVADDGDTDSDDESDGEGAGADVDAAERAARGEEHPGEYALSASSESAQDRQHRGAQSRHADGAREDVLRLRRRLAA